VILKNAVRVCFRVSLSARQFSDNMVEIVNLELWSVAGMVQRRQVT